MYSYIWDSLLKVYFHAPKCTFNPNPIWDQKWKHGKCRIMVCNSKTLQCAKESKCGELPAVFIFTNKAFFTDNSDRAQDLVVGCVFFQIIQIELRIQQLGLFSQKIQIELRMQQLGLLFHCVHHRQSLLHPCYM